MLRVQLDKIVEGMVLAKPVMDDRGALILNEGFELTPAWGNRLKTRGIEHVFVHEGAGSEPIGVEGETQKRQLAQQIAGDVDVMFAGTEANETMRQLAHSAKKYLLRKKLSKSE